MTPSQTMDQVDKEVTTTVLNPTAPTVLPEMEPTEMEPSPTIPMEVMALTTVPNPTPLTMEPTEMEPTEMELNQTPLTTTIPAHTMKLANAETLLPSKEIVLRMSLSYNAIVPIGQLHQYAT